MPALKPRSALLRMVDSDLEDESSDLSLAVKSRVAATTIMAPKKRGRPAGSTNKVTKPAQKSTSCRTSGRLAAAAAEEIQQSPQALSDGSNEQRTGTKDTTPDVEEKPKRGRPRTTKAATKSTDIEHENEAAVIHDAPPQPSVPSTRGRPGRKPASAKTEIPETQLPNAMDVDEEGPDELEELPSRPSSGSSNVTARGSASSPLKSQPAADADMNDSALRRRLGELTRKHEALETKYRQLQEVGTREAERNFDRFKKQADERAQSESTSGQLHVNSCMLTGPCGSLEGANR